KERAGHAAETAPFPAQLLPEADQVLGGPPTQEASEATVGGCYAHHPGGVLPYAFDLRAIADRARGGDQIVDVAVAEARDELGIEAGEHLFHRRPLVLDDLPDEPGAEDLLGQRREKELVRRLGECRPAARLRQKLCKRTGTSLTLGSERLDASER